MSEKLAPVNDPAVAATIDAMQAPAKIERNEKPLAGLYRDEATLKKVFVAIEQAVYRSFVDDARANPNPLAPPKVTDKETKRRGSICIEWLRRARGELDYSWEQSVDQMYHALRCELDGKVFEPRKAGSLIWTPT
jgi:hypothetical protein